MRAITFRRATRATRATRAVLVWALVPLMALAGAPEVGQSAPTLIARQFDGRPIDLAALHGKVVVLNFWASWCGPCRAEMPALDALARDLREQGVVIIGLSADDRHDRRDALKAAEGRSYALGMLSDATRNDFGAPQVLPLTYVIDRQGVIRNVLSANRGAVSVGDLRAAVEAALLATKGDVDL